VLVLVLVLALVVIPGLAAVITPELAGSAFTASFGVGLHATRRAVARTRLFTAGALARSTTR
jgi:hypothetical protein